MIIEKCPTYTAQQRDQIADGDQDPSGVHRFGLVWRDKTGHVVAREGDQLLAHAGWVEVDLNAGSRTIPAVGLGSVLVHPRVRGRGVGKMIVSAAMASMRRRRRLHFAWSSCHL
jgi:predicted N-acetyltransferase YhbS